MENDLLFTPTQHAIVGHAFAVALGAHIVGFLYFLSRQGQVAPRFRTSTWLSMAVMAAWSRDRMYGPTSSSRSGCRSTAGWSVPLCVP